MLEKEEEFEEKDQEVILDAELKLDEECEKKDLKEKRGYIKDHFYAGSKKMKHKGAGRS
ncbi:MAG: hypothetical protein IME96_00025 [Proteobacteria bacterium]|nr:hypothetical protein [Pseudomonadota bacterium]